VISNFIVVMGFSTCDFPKGKTRIEFPRILHLKDVKVGDNEVESAMNINIVSLVVLIGLELVMTHLFCH